MPLSVRDDGRRRIEPHRLGIQEGADKRLRVVAPHPRCRIGDERKARRVTLREPILAEPADLLENPLGEFRRDALLDHARDEPVVMLLDSPLDAPRRHVAPQLVGLARRVIGRDDRELHDLFLKERHAERLLQNRLQRRMRIDDGLLAVAPPEERMNHPARDRARPDDRDLDDEVVVGARLEAREHRHLRPALDLEDADRVRALDHREGRRILRRDRRHGDVMVPVRADEIEREVELRQTAEPEQVDLEEP